MLIFCRFTEMINLFRLEDNNYSVEITQPHVLITPERQPMLTPLFKSIQDDMLRLLYCRSGVVRVCLLPYLWRVIVVGFSCDC